MRIFKKEKKVVGLVTEHLGVVEQCLEMVTVVAEHYLAGELDDAKKSALEVDEIETKADALRREIHETLFSGAYLPLIREDIHALVESVDRVANAGEDCADFFLSQRPDVPEGMRAAFLDIQRASCAIAKPLSAAMSIYFKPKGKVDDVRAESRKVRLQETLVDEKEWTLTRQIFDSPLDLSQKLHLKLALDHVAEIADRAEDAADRLELAGLKSVI